MGCQRGRNEFRTDQQQKQKGAENDGWTVAKTLLTFERSSAYAARLQSRLSEMRPLVMQTRENALITRFNELAIRVQGLEMSEFRIQSALAAGQSPGAASSQMKIMATETQQAIDEMMMAALGHYGVPWQPQARELGYNSEPVGPDEAPTLQADFLNNRAASIYGGSNEVQRNIIAKAALGL